MLEIVLICNSVRPAGIHQSSLLTTWPLLRTSARRVSKALAVSATGIPLRKSILSGGIGAKPAKFVNQPVPLAAGFGRVGRLITHLAVK